MKYHETCECCEQKITAYTHNLNEPLVKALKQLVDYYERHKDFCNLQKGLSLTKNQYNNFQKLQYFGLVDRSQNGWIPTEDGIAFIEGRKHCYKTVATMRGKVLPMTHPAWETHAKASELVKVTDIDVFSYKQRIEYQEEKSGQTAMPLNA